MRAVSIRTCNNMVPRSGHIGGCASNYTLPIVAAISLNNLHEKDRDARRIQNMNDDIRIAMQMVYNKYESYSQNLGCVQGDLISSCEGGRLQEFLPLIKDIKDPVGAVSCLEDCSLPCNYAWKILQDDDYEVLFYLENGLISNTEKGCYSYGPEGAEKYDSNSKK